MARLTSLINSKRQTIHILFVASWCHNLIIEFSFICSTMALTTWFFMVNLRKKFVNPKSLLKVRPKPNCHEYQLSWMYNNVVWSWLDGLQMWIQNFVITNIVKIPRAFISSWFENLHSNSSSNKSHIMVRWNLIALIA